MKRQFSKNFSAIAKEVHEFIKNFDSEGIKLGETSRNIIKTKLINSTMVNAKSFKTPHLINQVIYKFFRPSKARRSYQYANKLISLKIGTPKPIAYYEFTTAFLFKKSYYVSEHLDYGLTYRELVTNPDYPDHENILRQFTKFTWQMHEVGVNFKDHSPGNTLITKNGEDYDFYLVDLNRMSFTQLDFKTRMKNLSRLTPKKDMVKVMSEEYAKLSGYEFEKVFAKMWKYTEKFQEKFHRKKRLKATFLRRNFQL